MIGQVAARDLGDGCREDKPEFGGKKMLLRNYQTSDCEKLAALFYQTVHCVNVRDYTKEQLNAWATGQIDLK